MCRQEPSLPPAQTVDQVQGPSCSTPLLLRFYKGLISPSLHTLAPSTCLYLPTCSEYAYVALSRFGVIRGGWIAVRRVLRCNPFATGGLDPVPEAHARYDRLP